MNGEENHPDPDKITAVTDVRTTQKTLAVKSFVRFLSYVRSFSALKKALTSTLLHGMKAPMNSTLTQRDATSELNLS